MNLQHSHQGPSLPKFAQVVPKKYQAQMEALRTAALLTPINQTASASPNNHNTEQECICYRPPATILCANCHGSFAGRIRYACPRHVNVSTFELLPCCKYTKAIYIYIGNLHVGVLHAALYALHLLQGRSSHAKRSPQKLGPGPSQSTKNTKCIHLNNICIYVLNKNTIVTCINDNN